MESIRNDELGYYVIVFNFKVCTSAHSNKIWIHGKGICLSLGYKDYRNTIILNVDSFDKKKPACQDKRYRCYFLNKSGVYSLINKSRKSKVKCQFLEWLENEVYNKKSSCVNRVYKKVCEAPKKFKSNCYKKRKSTSNISVNNKDIEIIKEATKEALEDAEINYYGLSDYLKEDDKRYNKVFTKHYEKIYYEQVDISQSI